MNVGSKLLHNLIKIVCPVNNFFLFEEEYLHNIICMWYLGFKAVDFLCSSNSWFRKIYFLKRPSSSKINNGAIKKKFSKICQDNYQLLFKKINLDCMDQNEVSSADILNNVNSTNEEKCSFLLKDSDRGSLQESNSTKKVKKHPNYFVAVQITDHKVHSSVKIIQDHILSQDDCFEKCLISRSTLHITLEVMHLKDSEDCSRAVKALNAVHKKYNYIMCKEPLQLEFTGVGHFGNRVLYAKIKENVSYNRLCDLAENVGQQLKAVGINIYGSKKKFNPHLTIAKLTYVKKNSKTKKIPPSLYEEFIDFHFGYDVVKSIQLLKMTGPKNSLGYYMGEELFFSLKEPMFWKKLNSLLTVAEKKRDIRKKISALAEKILK